MKRHLILLTLALLTLSACHTSHQAQQAGTQQHYSLRTVSPCRIEVTSALDSRPLQAACDFLRPYQAGVDSLQRPYIGRSAQFMTPGRPESLLSNWVADALVAEAEQLGYKADLGLCNVGGLRSAMPQDTVRRGDIIAISPFENFFTILEMQGSDMLRLMQNIAAVHGEGVSHNLRLVITKDGRVQSATIAGQPIDPERTYTIATLDYLADGNDKMTALKDSRQRTVTEVPVRDVLMNHLRRLDAAGQMAEAAIEGRIVEVE